MIFSRGRSILRICTKTRSLLSNSQVKDCVSKKWHGQYSYRNSPDIYNMDKKDEKVVKYLGAFVWWWFLWHLFTEYDTLLGLNDGAPDPEQWTDEELGIPPL